MPELSQTEATIVAAFVGAFSGLLVVIVKDILIEGRRTRRRERRELLNRSLTEIYSPLWIGFGGKEGTISNVIQDKELIDRVQSHFHLLSPELQDIIERSLLIGARGSYDGYDLKRIIELDPAFKRTLKEDMEKMKNELLK